MIAITGPTGSGKSSLALHLAQAFAGEIVNCDSMQLYRGFDVGTAKLPDSQRLGIPHHLFDVLEPREGYSAGDYARAARQVIAGISGRSQTPIVAGGTGFYLRGLLEGLPQLPGRDESLRQRLTARENRRPGCLHRLLERLDAAAAARIHANDTQKLVRALEVRILTRGPAPAPERAQTLDGYRTLKLGLNPDRGILYERLDARTQEMFRATSDKTTSDKSGLVEEVRALLAAGCTGDEKPFESLGYKQALRYVRGEMSLEDAITSTRIETRQYAKRQWTWFRRDPEVVWLDGFGDAQHVMENAAELVRKHIAA